VTCDVRRVPLQRASAPPAHLYDAASIAAHRVQAAQVTRVHVAHEVLQKHMQAIVLQKHMQTIVLQKHMHMMVLQKHMHMKVLQKHMQAMMLQKHSGGGQRMQGLHAPEARVHAKIVTKTAESYKNNRVLQKKQNATKLQLATVARAYKSSRASNRKQRGVTYMQQQCHSGGTIMQQ